MILASDRLRIAQAHASYDKNRKPYWDMGSWELPRLFMDHNKDGSLVITAEGSRPIFEHPTDWKVDFDQIDLIIDPTCSPVPHGWGRALVGVMFRVLAEIDDPSLAVGWNGHSMGASYALMGAWLWKLAGRPLARVTAWEPGPVGPLGGYLKGEDVLITRVGDGLTGDPVPNATLRGHPGELTILPKQDNWSPFDCHDSINVAVALDIALKAKGL